MSYEKYNSMFFFFNKEKRLFSLSCSFAYLLYSNVDCGVSIKHINDTGSTGLNNTDSKARSRILPTFILCFSKSFSCVPQITARICNRQDRHHQGLWACSTCAELNPACPFKCHWEGSSPNKNKSPSPVQRT